MSTSKIAAIAAMGLLLAGAAYAADSAKTAKPMKEPVRHTFQVSVDGKVVKFTVEGQDQYVFNIPGGGSITIAAASARQKLGQKLGLAQKRWNVTYERDNTKVALKGVKACSDEPGAIIGVPLDAGGLAKVCAAQ